MVIESKKKAALRRKHHVRKKVFGTPERPRLSVFRSNRHIYAQIIDDVAGATLVSTRRALNWWVRRLPKRRLGLGLSVYALIEAVIDFMAG
jgi:ribosomal protein L18